MQHRGGGRWLQPPRSGRRRRAGCALGGAGRCPGGWPAAAGAALLPLQAEVAPASGWDRSSGRRSPANRRGGRLGRVIQVADCSDESYLQRRDCATALPKAYRHKHMHTQHHTAQQRETERERVLQRHRFRREYSTAQHSLSRRGTGQSTQLNRQTRTETTAKKMHRLSSSTCLLLCLDDALHPLLGALFWGRTLRPNVQVWLFISEILEGGEATFRP